MFILFALGTIALIAFVSFATYRTGQLLEYWQPEENLLLLPGENLVRLGLIAVCIGLGFISPQTPEQLGWLPADPLGDIAIGALAGVAISLALLPPTLWILHRRPEWYNDVVLRNIRPHSRREWLLVILALIPVALLEELLFRSLLLGGFAPYVNVIYFAIAAAILFGLLHRPQGEWGIVGVTLVALVLSALFLWRGSLLVVVIAHWVTNVGQLLQAERFERQEHNEAANE